MDDGAAQRSPLVNDIFGGLTTAIVALPLALAFGVASGGAWRRTAVLHTHITFVITVAGEMVQGDLVVV
jgi:MFS superfamily sulfate permease-like transporter